MNETIFKPRVAFQGERGAFSEEAAVKLCGDDVVLVSRPTFESLFAAIGDGAADYVLAPIENSLAGSVQPSYDLLLESSLNIAAEVVIPIRHCLVGCSGASFDAIGTVESHPVALAQCGQFFAAHPRLRRRAAEDTAGSVARVVALGDLTVAAIAGRRAAELYGGAVLRNDLEDHPENYTRFILLEPATSRNNDGDKISLIVRLPHRPGALHHALEPFARRDIDLLGLVSRPLRGRPWEYHFYLDVRGSMKDREVTAAMTDLRDLALEVRFLGCYFAAPTPVD